MSELPHHPMTYAARGLRRRATESERLVWEELRDRRFRGLKFRRQQPFGGRFVLDFYCAELRRQSSWMAPSTSDKPASTPPASAPSSRRGSR